MTLNEYPRLGKLHEFLEQAQLTPSALVEWHNKSE